MLTLKDCERCGNTGKVAIFPTAAAIGLPAFGEGPTTIPFVYVVDTIFYHAKKMRSIEDKRRAVLLLRSAVPVPCPDCQNDEEKEEDVRQDDLP